MTCRGTHRKTLMTMSKLEESSDKAPENTFKEGETSEKKGGKMMEIQSFIRKKQKP